MRFLTPDPEDPLDPLDPLDPADPADPAQSSPWAPMTRKIQYTGTFFRENEAHIALKGPAAPRRPKNPQDGPKMAHKGTKCDDFEEKTPKVRPRRGPGAGPGAPGRGRGRGRGRRRWR